MGSRRWALAALMLGAAVCLAFSGSMSADPGNGGDGNSAPGPASAPGANPSPSLDETRLKMDKWIETQQIIARERNDWQQGKEILIGRLDLVKREIATLDEKITQAQSKVSEADRNRSELLAENDQFKAAGAQLTEAVTGMEVEIRRLFKPVPEPIQTRIEPLFQRIPEDPATTRVSIAERFQNVLGILNEVNKANTEINVSYEVRTLADGRPSEVKAIYIGLAQAYYVSARGEAGIGWPSADGWTWTSSDAVAPDVLMALEILQGKQTPAFVPLPVKLQ